MGRKYGSDLRVRVDEGLRDTLRQSAKDWGMSEACVVRALLRAAPHLDTGVLGEFLQKEKEEYDAFRDSATTLMAEAKMRKEGERRREIRRMMERGTTTLQMAINLGVDVATVRREMKNIRMIDFGKDGG